MLIVQKVLQEKLFGSTDCYLAVCFRISW